MFSELERLEGYYQIMGFLNGVKEVFSIGSTLDRMNQGIDGVVNYKSCSVENFFESQYGTINTIVSGGADDIRFKVLRAHIAIAINDGFPVIVLHQGNPYIGSRLRNEFGGVVETNIVDIGSACYDPFYDLDGGAISELVMGAAPKSFDIKHNAKYYIEGVVELLKKSKKKPYFNLLATCPHTTLFDKIDDLVGKNQISDSDGQEIKSKLMIGQSESAKIESYRNDNFYNDSLKSSLDSSSVDDFIAALERFDELRSVLSYIEGEGEQSQGVLSEMYSVIRDILIGVFAERGGFSIRNFVRAKGGKVLFIEYDLAIGSVLTPIYRLFFDLAIKEALGRTSSQGNVYLFCDEFKLLPNLQHIDDGVNFGRSLGLKVFAGLQSIEQLFETYGEIKGRNLAAGFSSIFAFKANDVSTRDYIRSLYGSNIILEQYQGMNKTLIEDKREGNTVEDWDLNSLKVGEAVVGLPFEKPFKFYFDNFG